MAPRLGINTSRRSSLIREVFRKLAGPILLSLWLHSLLFSFPVSVIPGGGIDGFSDSLRIDAQLVTVSPTTSKDLQVAPVSFEDAVPPVGSLSTRSELRLSPASAPIAIATNDRYFNASELDQRAEAIEISDLIYPEDAYLRRIAGSVTLRLFINEIGEIDGVDVVSAEPAEIFNQAAIDAILATRFKPARLLSQAVKSIKTVEINFDPHVDR